jgi:hypothetical protein
MREAGIIKYLFHVIGILLFICHDCSCCYFPLVSPAWDCMKSALDKCHYSYLLV